MSGRTSWLGTRVARHPATRAFPRAIGIARASVLFGGIDRWFSIVPHAWQQSLVNRWLDRTFGHLDASQRVRLIGWAVLAAALTHAVLAAPALLDNWRAMIIWALGSAIGLVFLVASGPLAAAWRSRRS